MVFEKHKFRDYHKVLFIFFIFPFVLFYPNPFDESQESIIILANNHFDELSIKLFDVRTETKPVSFKANNSYNLSLNCSFVKILNEFILKMLNISNSEFFSFENESSNDGSCELAIERKYGSLVNTNAKYMIEYNYNNLFCNVSIAYSSIKDGCFFVYLCNHSFLNYCGENDDVVTIFLNYLNNVTYFLNDENKDSNETNNSINSSNLYVEENNSIDYLNYSSEIVKLENLSLENNTKNNSFENNNSNVVILSSSNLSNSITSQNSSNNLSENKTLESNLSLENQLFEVQIDDVFYEDESISYTIINKGCKGVFEKKVYGIDGLGKQIVKIFSNSTISTRRTFKFTLPSGNYLLSIKCENFEINSSFEVLLKQNSCEDIFKRISFLKTQISFLKENDCTFQFSCYYPEVFDTELNIKNKKSFKYSELNCYFFKISYEDLFYYYAISEFINEFTTISISNKKEKNQNKYYVVNKKGSEIYNNSNILNYLKISSKLSINNEFPSFTSLIYNYSIISNLLDIEIYPRLLGCEISLNYHDFYEEQSQKEKKQKGNNDKNFKNNELVYSFNLNEFKNKNNFTQRINLTQFQYVENSVTLYFNKNNSVLNFKKNFSLISDFIVVLFLDFHLNNSSLLNLAPFLSESNSNSSNFKLLYEKTDEGNTYDSFIEFNIPFLNDNEEFEDGLLIENLVENSISNLTISENLSYKNLSSLSNITNNSEVETFQSKRGFSIFIKRVFQKISGFFVRFFKK
ncbi:MAG: hypothetical protein QXR30_01675 [Candidatus Woesearchaeota archaeon]